MLKDWKKVTQNRTFTTWQRGNDEDFFVTIIKQTYDPHAWGYKKPIDYIVNVGTHANNFTEKHFKTKSQALKFARNYMRRN